jgi:hypothetical protein
MVLRRNPAFQIIITYGGMKPLRVYNIDVSNAINCQIVDVLS